MVKPHCVLERYVKTESKLVGADNVHLVLKSVQYLHDLKSTIAFNGGFWKIRYDKYNIALF